DTEVTDVDWEAGQVCQPAKSDYRQETRIVQNKPLLPLGGSALLDCPDWHRGGGRCRLPRDPARPACLSGRTARPARRTERFNRINHSGAYCRLMLIRAHPQLLIAVDDRARFKQDCRHVGVAEHEQLVVAIDSRLRIDQQPLAMAHDPIRVVGRVLQSALSQLSAQQPGKLQTAGTVAVVIRDENGMTTEAVAETALPALELPFFQELVGHGIVMNGQEEISSESIGALDARRQSLPRSTFRDQKHAAPESGAQQQLLDAFGKFQIEHKLRGTARACRARRLCRVPDIDDYAECLARAGMRGPGLGTRLRRGGTGERCRNGHPQDAQQPKHDPESPDVPWAITPQYAHSMAAQPSNRNDADFDA